MNDVAYTEIEAKSALNRVRGMPFDWSFNPYTGCAHACSYCFSRAYHARYRDRDVGAGFDKNIEVKKNSVEEFRKQLRRRPEGSVAIGTATDPYQPIEGKYQLTRRCLEALVDYPMPTSIVTKGGPLVVRDIDVLKKLDEKTGLTVYFSVPCVDEEIVRKTDPGTAPPRQRLRALHLLREAGLDAAVLCMPVLPGISDSEESLDAAARAASRRPAPPRSVTRSASGRRDRPGRASPKRCSSSSRCSRRDLAASRRHTFVTAAAFRSTNDAGREAREVRTPRA